MDRFTWGIVIGVVALVAVGIGAVVATRDRQAPPDLTTPGGVALAFELALDRGDADTAWALLSPATQANTTRDRFIQRATNARGPQPGRQRIAIDAVQVDGDTARVDVVRVFPESANLFNFGSGYSIRSTARLALVDGAWRITVPSEPYLLPDPDERLPRSA